MSVEQVAITGFNVPGHPGPNVTPPAASQVPGFVPNMGAPAPAPQAGNPVSEADIQARIDAAVAAAMKPGTPAPAATAPTNITDDDVNDPVLRSLTGVFLSGTQQAGIDMNRAIGQALSTGDVSRIDKAYIAEKGGANAEHLQTLATAIVERVQAAAVEATTAAHGAAGGKAQWDAATAVFNTSAPQHLKVVVAKMLDSADPGTIKAAAQMVVDYTKTNGLVPTPGNFVQAGAANADPSQALSKAEFQQLHSKLNPNSRTYMADRTALHARRTLGIATGK